jgi:hypothetical protein
MSDELTDGSVFYSGGASVFSGAPKHTLFCRKAFESADTIQPWPESLSNKSCRPGKDPHPFSSRCGFLRASCTMFKLLATVAIHAALTVSMPSNLVSAENVKPLSDPHPYQAQNPLGEQDKDDPVSFFESLLPPRFRKLGTSFNPLQCVGDSLLAGDKLVIGQAVCFAGYEFGVADNGKVTFFDHWNHHPEVVVWQEPMAKGSYLYLDPNGCGLVLYNDEDEAVWQIGTTTTSDTSAVSVLEVTENGTVKLSFHDNGDQKIHWSLSLDGAITVA